MSGENELAAVIRSRLQQLHEIAPGSIGDLMAFELLDADTETQKFTFRCKTFAWMRNAAGTLHGGMCATVLDQAMGFIAYCLKPGTGTAPTVQMQQSYHRPLIPGEDVVVKVEGVSVTRSLIHLRAEAFRADVPDKLCVSATAIYFYKPEA